MADEWMRFYEVTEHVPADRRLFRSSAPNYNKGGQPLTQSAVDFLVSQGVNSIISFHQLPYGDTTGKSLLESAGILYHHIPVADFTAPTQQQLKDAVEFFASISSACTLVHCGYGHGRTGTGVTALQLAATQGKNPGEEDWIKINHVETASQIQALRQFRDSLQSD